MKIKENLAMAIVFLISLPKMLYAELIKCKSRMLRLRQFPSHLVLGIVVGLLVTAPGAAVPGNCFGHKMPVHQCVADNSRIMERKTSRGFLRRTVPLLTVSILAIILIGGQTVFAVTPTDLITVACPTNLGSCTANDVTTTVVSAVGVNGDTCTGPGDTINVDITLNYKPTSAERYDLGLFLAQSGNVNNGLACVGAAAPIGGGGAGADGAVFLNLDPTGHASTPTTPDTCGDMSNPLQPSGVSWTVRTTVECVPDANNNLVVDSCRVWEQNANHKSSCIDLASAGTGSKCDCTPLTITDIPVPFTGNITVNKVLDPSTDPGKFNLTIDGATAGTGGNVGNGGTTGKISVSAGTSAIPGATHTVGETAVLPTTLSNYTTNITCTDGATVIGPVSGTSIPVTVNNDQNWVCTIDNTRNLVPPDITVTKTANPTSMPEPGGTVQFTVTVTNNAPSPMGDALLNVLTDNVYGNLNGQGDCNIPATLVGNGGIYSCTFSGSVTGVPGDTKTDTVTATAANALYSDTAQASASVTITDVAAVPLNIVKSATPLTLPEPGGEFSFTAVITNPSTVDTVTITSVSDTYGTPDCGGVTTLTPGASVTCTFKVTHNGNAGDLWKNVVAVVATDDDGASVGGNSNEVTVSLTDVPSSPLTVVKSTSTPALVAPGGTFQYSVVVTNPASNVDSISIAANGLKDSFVGTLTSCSPALPVTLAPGQSTTCTFSATHTGVGGEVFKNTVTATGTDDDGKDASATSNEVTVTVLAATAMLAPTQTTCQDYAGGTAADLTFLSYGVSKGMIGSVAPGVMFYYSTITAPSSSFTLEIRQWNDSVTAAGYPWPMMDTQKANQVILWENTCTKLQTVTVTYANDGHPILSATGATTGATYYLGVKIDPTTLKDTPITVPKPQYPTVKYTFATWLNGGEILTSLANVDVKPK